MNAQPMRIELLLAYPPTQKCRAIKAIAAEALEQYPGLLRIDEYEAGTTCPLAPTQGYRTTRSGTGKFKKIPSVFVNGVMVSAGEIPEREVLFQAIETQLISDRAP
ncbi:MAG: hypothetical protein WA705_00795 [Candidatus Ozemobacteraceae bacterium]